MSSLESHFVTGFDFRVVKHRIGASLLSSVVTTSASWLLNSSAAVAGDQKNYDLRRLSSRIVVSTLLKFRYEKQTVRLRGRYILILVTMRRWSETSAHSFTTVSNTTSGSSVATTSRKFLPRVGSSTCEVRFNDDSTVFRSSLILPARLLGQLKSPQRIRLFVMAT